METEITKLIKECKKFIYDYYYVHKRDNLSDFEGKLKRLISLSKKNYPLLCEELEDAICKFDQNRNYYMGVISCALSLMEKEEKGINQKTKENKTAKQVLFWTVVGVVVAVIIGIVSNWNKFF